MIYEPMTHNVYSRDGGYGEGGMRKERLKTKTIQRIPCRHLLSYIHTHTTHTHTHTRSLITPQLTSFQFTRKSVVLSVAQTGEVRPIYIAALVTWVWGRTHAKAIFLANTVVVTVGASPLAVEGRFYCKQDKWWKENQTFTLTEIETDCRIRIFQQLQAQCSVHTTLQSYKAKRQDCVLVLHITMDKAVKMQCY